MTDRIGFIQGRLSPVLAGRIQCFPWPYWKEEFAAAEKNGFRVMEWTLDEERLYENPLLTPAGKEQIRWLSGKHKLSIPSLTGDCFMQAPFWKTAGDERARLERDFHEVTVACEAVGISKIVVPLVDHGRIDNAGQQGVLLAFLRSREEWLRDRRLQILFESDFGPAELAAFIEPLDEAVFGINYDIGNSASLGFDPDEELAAYGARVSNVHVKDRLRGGTTVPLGSGAADFERVFAALASAGYKGNYILQTARAADLEQTRALRRYRDMTSDWMSRHAA